MEDNFIIIQDSTKIENFMNWELKLFYDNY